MIQLVLCMKFKKIQIATVLLLLFTGIQAQEPAPPADSLQTTSDSLRIAPAPQPPLQLEPVIYNLAGGTDSSSSVIYSFENNLTTSYYGLGDVFALQPNFYILDFLVMGEPRYVSPLHLLPHQAAVYYEGVIQNDGLNGMFNTRLLSLDAVKRIETSETNQAGYSGHLDQGTEISGRHLNPEHPYTRIMFRQGDFGFTDLDIQFAKRFRDNLSVQLSGINRLNDLNNYQGTIYQGAINYQPAAKISGRLVYRQNHELLSRPQYTAFQNFRYKEFREDLISNWTYHCTDEQRWRLRVGYSTALRTNRYDIDSVKIRYRYRRFSTTLDRNLRWKKMELLAAVSLFQNQVWGNALARDYTDSGWLARLRLNAPLWSGFYVRPEYVYNSFYSQDGYATTSLETGFQSTPFLHLFMQYRSDRRHANRAESSFSYAPYFGNKDLKDETMSSLFGRVDWRPNANWRLQLSGGQQKLENEIRFTGTTFLNYRKRSFSYVTLATAYTAAEFGISAGGQISNSDIYLAPKQSFWLRLDYRDFWLNKALYLQGHATLFANDKHNVLQYNRYVERFFWDDRQEDGYYTLQFKISGTVRDAQFYMAMDNVLGATYQIIDGYPQLYRRVRFGLNWELWN